MLDFPHAVAHLGAAAQAAFGPGTPAVSAWVGAQAHALRHGGPAGEDGVLAALVTLAATPRLDGEATATIRGGHAYLATRRAQIGYRDLAAAGYPIGSGCVESANKLLVEARLKGPGMHWARPNVDPLLALRAVLANDRWAEAWPVLWRRACTDARRPSPSTEPPPIPAPDPIPPRPPRPKLVVAGTPTADHPWRRSSPFRAKR